MLFKKKNEISDIVKIFQEIDDNYVDTDSLYCYKRGVFTFKEYKGYTFLWKVDWNVSGTLVIPDGVSIIRAGALRGLDNVTSIIIADSVKVIAGNAIELCDNLRYIKLSAGIEYMGMLAINDCPALEEVSFPRHYDLGNCVYPIDKLYSGEDIKITRF